VAKEKIIYLDRRDFHGW